MPAVPKLLADIFEPRVGRRCHVARVDVLDSKLRRVRFAGAALQDLAFRSGQEIEFRVDATAFRHYTPVSYDPVAGSADVVFYLHDHGPGARWVRELRVEDQALLIGPGGRFTLAAVASTHILLGDESCLGLFGALAAVAPHVTGAVEVEPGCEGWPELAGVPLAAVTRTTRGAALRAWLDAAKLVPDHDTAIYLAGHAASITMLRDLLRARGWARSAIRTKPYWADGKRGL